MDFRHEYKLQISYADYIILKKRLQSFLRKDAHANIDGCYLIRSLYFDNLNDKALREKLEGVNFREKFRIRYYNFDDSFIRLEKKSKINGFCSKLSAPLSREQTEAIIRGDLSWMGKNKNALIVEFYSKMRSQLLRPRTIVQYTREAYTYPAGNVRITLDNDIRTCIYATDLFNRDAPAVPAGGNAIILEVKYGRYIPDVISDILQLKSRHYAAFSKYAACRIYG